MKHSEVVIFYVTQRYGNVDIVTLPFPPKNYYDVIYKVLLKDKFEDDKNIVSRVETFLILPKIKMGSKDR